MMLSDYYATDDGRIFRKSTGKELKYFKSNKYLQCVVFDDEGKTHTLGVHTVVARLRLPDFQEGYLVHHKDENTHNNSVTNLECMSRSEHAKLHMKDNRMLANYIKKHGPVNKGKPATKRFREKCRQSALKRIAREKLKGQQFHGNQYVKFDKGT